MRHCGKGNPLRVFQELQPNSLYRAVRFANFKGFWIFPFVNHLIGSGVMQISTQCARPT